MLSILKTQAIFLFHNYLKMCNNSVEMVVKYNCFSFWYMSIVISSADNFAEECKYVSSCNDHFLQV